MFMIFFVFFFFKQKTSYEMRISDCSSDVCSSDLAIPGRLDFIRSLPDYNGRLDEVFYGFATTRVGEGHAVHDDPRARPGMTRQEIIDRPIGRASCRERVCQYV